MHKGSTEDESSMPDGGPRARPEEHASRLRSKAWDQKWEKRDQAWRAKTVIGYIVTHQAQMRKRLSAASQ